MDKLYQTMALKPKEHNPKIEMYKNKKLAKKLNVYRQPLYIFGDF
jgi:hypothetical protein